MTDQARHLRRRKQRQERAAAKRLPPVRGTTGRLRTGGRGQRVVGLGQFADGLGRRGTGARHRAWAWLLGAVPVVVVVVWVVARVTRHL